MVKRRCLVWFCILTLWITGFCEIKPVEAASSVARLSKINFFYHGYRFPYVLSYRNNYYVKVESFEEVGLLGYSDGNYWFSNQRKQENYYNVEWKSIKKTGTVIGKIAKTKKRALVRNKNSTYEKYIPVYRIRQSDYVNIKDLATNDSKLNWNKARKAYYIGKLPSNKSHEDLIYKTLNKVIRYRKSNRKKLEAIHDYIVVRTDYNLSANTIKKNNEIIAKGYSMGLYTIQTQKGVCEHYARLFKEFCDRMFISCQLPTGANHMWNKVYHNGKWLYVDVTWDDPKGSGYKRANQVSRNYFLVTAKKMMNDHCWIASDYVLPRYQSSWKKINYNKIKTTGQYRRALVNLIKSSKGKKITKKIKIAIKNPWKVNTNSNFLYYYNEIGWKSLKCIRSADGKIVTIELNH